MSTYTLEVGDKGAIHLEILNDLLNQKSLDFMVQNGLKKNDSVMEFACGVGDFSREIAAFVGPTGNVFATDNSKETINYAKNKTPKSTINLCFECLDVANLETINQRFDVIYSRAIFCHIQNVKDVLKKVYNLLKPGGVYISEDIADDDAFVCFPESKAYNAWLDFRKKQESLFKTDFNIGYKLPFLGQQIGFKVREAQLIQPLLTNSYHKKLITLPAVEILPKLIEANLYSNEEADELIKLLEEFEMQEDCFPSYSRISQVAFERPS